MPDRQMRPAAPRCVCVLCKTPLRLPFTYGAAVSTRPVAMVLVLAIHTVATVSATVPFAMIMLRCDGSLHELFCSSFCTSVLGQILPMLAAVSTGCLHGVAVRAPEELFNAGITSGRTTSPQACTADS